MALLLLALLICSAVISSLGWNRLNKGVYSPAALVVLGVVVIFEYPVVFDVVSPAKVLIHIGVVQVGGWVPVQIVEVLFVQLAGSVVVLPIV